MYCGWRARIGLIMPGNGTNPEYEFHKYAPEGVTVMTQRVLFERVDPEGLREMGGRIDSAAKLLATAHPDLVLFGCTSGSLIGGFGYDLELIKRMEGQCGAKALTTSSAVLMALKALGAKRVVVATPYVDRVNEIEKKFLEDNADEEYLSPSLFYVWGHAYQLDAYQDWEGIESFFARLGNKEDIWYASNIEICQYILAVRSLIYSSTGDYIFNPTYTDVWLMIDGRPYQIPSGKTVSIPWKHTND